MPQHLSAAAQRVSGLTLCQPHSMAELMVMLPNRWPSNIDTFMLPVSIVVDDLKEFLTN